MNKMKWPIVLIIIFLCTPVFGEFYRYLDENGNVTYTDDLSQVPEDQRPKAKSYIESQSPLDEKADISKTGKIEPAKDSSAELARIRSELAQNKKELDKEYKVLMEEKEALSRAVKVAKTRVQIQKFNKRASKFAKNVTEYEKRRKAFETEVDKYHFRLKQDLEKRLENVSKKK